MRSQIRNAFIAFDEMTTSVVAIETDVVRDGSAVTGYGFNSNGRYAQGGPLRDRFLRRLLDADDRALLNADGTNIDPVRAWEILMANEKPGGHGERSVAVGVIDMALWDVVAKIAGQPLYRVLADRFGDGTWDDHVCVYAAGGYYSTGGAGSLQDELRSYIDAGYTHVKMKIGGVSLAEDQRRIEAALDVVGDGQRLAVDANARFDLKQSLEYAAALRPYGLRWYEEPGDPLDFDLHAIVAREYPGPIATGENLFSAADTRNLLRYGGLRPDRDVLQMDPVLSYGVVEYTRILDALHAHGWSSRRATPHGGHQLALNVASGLKLGGNESYPRVFEPFGGFAASTPVRDGLIALPDLPGVGFEAKPDLFGVLRSVVQPERRFATGRSTAPVEDAATSGPHRAQDLDVRLV